ncbi:MAG: ATPase, T2SS/T4P/T4SS family [Archangium sp.]|nr:ATPase, T2SS/T4P/T4SS family [Archangium sp.]
MARLDQLTEYLFTHPGSTLALDSEGPGFYVDAHGASTPVFKQTLRSGQILLLFADTVPRERSQDFLAGKPIDFVYETPRGALCAHMEMKGNDLRARVKLAAPGDELITSSRGLSSESSIAAPPPPTVDAPRTTLLSVIAQLAEKHASHLHLAAERHAFARVEGRLVCLEELGPFSATDLREAVLALAPQAMRETLGRKSSFEFSHVSKDAVFHVRGQQGRDGLSVVVRALPRQVPTPASLGVPDEFAHVLRGSGLWVVAGGAGQGTSTTVAALVQGALETRAIDVCTLESPVDYVLEPKKGLVQQLEIGVHAPSFAAALDDARRGDADLVVVGQLDDAETLAAALALADRGRLVLGVVHAKSALAAVQKLVDLAPHGTTTLAGILRGVFGQSLVPNTTGGRSLCWELLPGTDAVKAFVRDGALGQLAPLLTRTSDQSLMQLLVRGEVDADVALTHARDRTWFEDQLARVAHPRAA